MKSRFAQNDGRNRMAPWDFCLSKARRCGTFSDFFPETFMAFAIIKTGGRQYRVAEGDTIDVDFLDVEAGREGVFSDVLFHVDGEKMTHGSPLIEGASVTGKVLEQRKDTKVIAFKYRRRKGYHRTVGHRRKLTRVQITEISLGEKAKAKKAAKSAE
jgi:large subunit ribosomal protein L21